MCGLATSYVNPAAPATSSHSSRREETRIAQGETLGSPARQSFSPRRVRREPSPNPHPTHGITLPRWHLRHQSAPGFAIFVERGASRPNETDCLCPRLKTPSKNSKPSSINSKRAEPAQKLDAFAQKVTDHKMDQDPLQSDPPAQCCLPSGIVRIGNPPEIT